ncbi:MAG: biotin/lipoyl-binding protein [Candidatus Eremiobacteraeota bacterium]|nr:biotin/lipoyl-binding protein [Candidatus Eremiobacteraeota bacterium]MCW5868807.1 biotin/lipoyl-binding protein [Candidatus Eremiobacteraeota bacterium]
MIDRLLIANRGEIACRIARTCRALGIAVVAVFTEMDQNGLWVQEADQAFRVESYLDIESLLAVARQSQAGAVHPGFGFLAENVEFARAVLAAELTWIGPRPESMQLLADKESAKELARRAGVPVLPHFTLENAEFPLMVKAVAGGGGKGMRRVERREDLPAAMQSAASEAARSFGDDRLILEPLLLQARHVEVQVLGDQHGTVMHLGERDCSLQRRHQKVMEECPAPDLPIREQLHEAALRLARAAAYSNAGTVEFLVSGERFYFLEMNTRLQVEHPVTELVYGLDLVEWQLRVAQGERLCLDVKPRGHAVEVRLYAEDPRNHHRPCAGPVLEWRPPTGIRVESALQARDEISSHYDPMVAKLIAGGATRDEALRRLRRALDNTALFGVECNRDFLKYWLGRAHQQRFFIDTLDQHPWTAGTDEWAPWAAAAAQWLQWSGENWRNMPGLPPRWVFQEVEIVWQNDPCGWLADGRLWLERSGERRSFRVLWGEEEVWVASAQQISRLSLPAATTRAGVAGADEVHAPLTGSIVEVAVAPGQAVQTGDLLLRLEAMKMEHRLLSPRDGSIAEVLCEAGEVVQAKSLLVRLA